jgi:hypothetical protein
MDKFHTVRAGHRFKPGDKFSPRVWMGKPYRSEQLILGPDVEVKKTWNFEVDENGVSSLNGKYIMSEGVEVVDPIEARIAENDGLIYRDFCEWIIRPCFKNGAPFHGQIISWSDKIEYP